MDSFHDRGWRISFPRAGGHLAFTIRMPRGSRALPADRDFAEAVPALRMLIWDAKRTASRGEDPTDVFERIAMLAGVSAARVRRFCLDQGGAWSCPPAEVIELLASARLGIGRGKLQHLLRSMKTRTTQDRPSRCR
jgi:hypothetical protein